MQVYHNNVLVTRPNYYSQSYFWVSIITTILCLSPIGIFAIILSKAVSSSQSPVDGVFIFLVKLFRAVQLICLAMGKKVDRWLEKRLASAFSISSLD